MGKAKRREEAAKGMEMREVIVQVRGEVRVNSLSNVSVECNQTGNWLVLVTTLTRALSIAVEEHTKQLFAAMKDRIVKPTDGDISRLS